MFPARYYRENINTFNKRNINLFNKSLTDCLFSLKYDVASNFCRNIVNIYIQNLNIYQGKKKKKKFVYESFIFTREYAFYILVLRKVKNV